jgi:hypothetical protein
LEKIAIMAFIRTERKKSGSYLRVIENTRDETGKTRQKTLYSLGKAENYFPESLKKMGEVLYSLGGGDPAELRESTKRVR